jgi:mannose-1-phosphate guanylyltransferase/mannose-6-phosphate isomerase
MKVIPVLMSGGSGARLWPLSTPDRPKQFHALAGLTETMIQNTARRFKGRVGEVEFLSPVVVGNVAHAQLIMEQLEPVAPAQAILLEPEGRNTAATALLAALVAQAIDPEALVFLAPADHIITDQERFRAVIAATAPLAKDRIVTLGITPTGPETGFGYIEQGEHLSGEVFTIKAFAEKPSLAVAQGYFDGGRHLWNAGMFFFSPRVVIEEFATLPAITGPVTAAFQAARQEGRLWFLPQDHFGAAAALPFDIAIMEKTTRGAVAPCSIGWADVGSWGEVWRLGAQSTEGVVTQGPVAHERVKDSLIYAESIPVGVIGLEGVIVVATPEGILVAAKEHTQQVKSIANALAQRAAEGKNKPNG